MKKLLIYKHKSKVNKLGIAVSIGAAFYILKILEKRGGEFMIGLAFCMASCIVRGYKKYSDVPAPMKEFVKQALIEMGAEELIDLEKKEKEEGR